MNRVWLFVWGRRFRFSGSKLSNETMQIGATDAETLGSSDLIAGFRLESCGDHPTPERDGCAFERRLVCRRRIFRQGALHIFRQKLDAETRARRQDDKAL